MIEDLQDEYPKLKRKNLKENSGLRVFWKILLIWFVFALLATALNMKNLMASFKENSPEKMIDTAMEKAKKTETKTLTLYFVNPEGNGVQPFQSNVKVSSSSPLMEALEGLFKGPDDNILAHGYITHISSDAKLFDVQKNGTTASVTVSVNFLNDTFKDNNKLAESQILETLKIVDPTISNLEIITKE